MQAASSERLGSKPLTDIEGRKFMHSRRFAAALATAVFAGMFLAYSLASAQQKLDKRAPSVALIRRIVRANLPH
jgi:hypothetical protein